MIESATRRRALLAVLVLVIVACLGTVAVVIATRSTGDDLGERLSSLQEGEVPGSSVSEDREQLLTLSRQFATRFNTYDPSMLDADGHLPDYAAVSDLMTPKFGGVFADNVGYAEQTVSQLGVTSKATVYAVGVASQDEDSAEVLVAGTVELTSPYPTEENGDGTSEDPDGTGEGEEEPQQLSTGPQRFRYEVSLVKVDGTWLVDDVDDIDDGLPSFSEPSIPEPPSGDPSATTPPATTPPTDTPSDEATAEQSGEGEG
ncbi:hypothetical protein D0Z08_04420 [Nocardioides immobilis]|uniref:Mce-associated membrane protein n=1 Tax=Nocardioides immobilis TaxID=2049295 RepID=A0A417Y6W7_9ACTN|nr:hypothetical protein [Nocardioides immobilis]RHW28234.1 hypothetical protein D0Z08_04420 [Nocardioides immobilis]